MSDSQTPAVEMLWEADDPHLVLDERFGFGDAASAGRWVAATLHQHWGVRVDSCERIVISARNALAWVTTRSGQLLAKWSVAPALFPRLGRIARLVCWLDGRGLPVSVPIPSLGGRRQIELDDVSICLQRVIEGELLDVENRDQVWSAGATLARLHHALEAYPGTDHLVGPEDRPEPLAARVTDWLSSAGQHVPDVGRHALRKLVADAPSEVLPMHLVHGDFRSSNVLCTGPTVTAVIDFEEARLDHCIDEVARSAVMLGTRFRDWGPVSAEVRTRFLSGYQSVRRLTPVEEGWWNVLVLWYALALVPPGIDPTGWGPSALDHLEDLTSDE